MGEPVVDIPLGRPVEIQIPRAPPKIDTLPVRIQVSHSSSPSHRFFHPSGPKKTRPALIMVMMEATTAIHGQYTRDAGVCA